MGSTFKIFYFYISKFLARKKNYCSDTSPISKGHGLYAELSLKPSGLIHVNKFFVELRPITPGKPTKLSGTALD